jgi:hypothetical protein
LRTGSVGGRNAEDLIKTISVEKRKFILEVREILFSLAYSEDVEYDAINVESVIVYSKHGTQRFLLKHKWDLSVHLIVHSDEDAKKIVLQCPDLSDRRRKDEDSGISFFELDPRSEKDKISKIAQTDF